mmetsp:Transcript_46617/g.92740  ORF Transcript_46617/g.92740 Transcript_46617/m.92740 type:complete len:184 (-) Transcript_46617:2-553(-)
MTGSVLSQALLIAAISQGFALVTCGSSCRHMRSYGVDICDRVGVHEAHAVALATIEGGVFAVQRQEVVLNELNWAWRLMYHSALDNFGLEACADDGHVPSCSGTGTLVNRGLDSLVRQPLTPLHLPRRPCGSTPCRRGLGKPELLTSCIGAPGLEACARHHVQHLVPKCVSTCTAWRYSMQHR